MAEGWLRLAAVVSNACGVAWLALAMTAHWQQVRPDGLSVASTLKLRALGASALAASLLLCLWVDHVSMALIVWIMALTASAFAIAFTLAWRPRWLVWLVAWLA